MTTGKFPIPGSAAAVSAALILLSVSAMGERQCSWCGPLAEQVHRSQRAPPCDSPGQTTCDEGHPHCAIVASSPPYVESRLCVKYYQDECYSIFCNSTRTWRMTCPCRGDLCNIEKTEREDEAFAFLARLGSKIQNLRIRKRTVTPVKFVSQRSNRTAIVNNENLNEGNTSDEVDKTVRTDKNNITDISNNDMNSETEVKNSEENMPNDQPQNDAVNEVNTNNDQNEMNKDEDKTTEGVMNESNKKEVEVTTRTPNVIVTSAMPREMSVSTTTTTQKDPIMEPDSSTKETPHKDINVDVANNINHAAEIAVTEKSIEKISMKTEIKPSMQMPTAEALQQNTSPSPVTQKPEMTTEKIPETTVMMMTTKENSLMTTTPDPMKMKKNNSVKLSLNNLLVLFWTLLFFM